MSQTTSTLVQERFMAAWNAHDLPAILALITEDCQFVTADGREFHGLEQLSAFFPTVWLRLPDAHWAVKAHVRAGARGFSEWVFTGTDASGAVTRAVGVDILTFRGDRICRKDAFRKGPAAPAG